jgi:hypothetical protein
MCEKDFQYTSGTERGILQMLNEGYYDITSGNTNCLLSAATFVAQVEVSGVTYSRFFLYRYNIIRYTNQSTMV